MANADADSARIRAVLSALGIPPDLPARRGLPLCRQARRLTPVGLGADGRDKLLSPAAARAWLKLRERASADGVQLTLISAFRSIDFQAALIRSKLERGMALAEVLRINAPPGYSEHHSGRAVDIGTDKIPALDEAFESTDAFRWLSQHAGRFGFRLSYPRGNAVGFAYEPWHWYYTGHR